MMMILNKMIAIIPENVDIQAPLYLVGPFKSMNDRLLGKSDLSF